MTPRKPPRSGYKSPPSEIDSGDLKWVAGFLEGEGSFYSGKRRDLIISAGQLQKWPLEKLASICGSRVTGHKHKLAKFSWQWRLYGAPAYKLMTMLEPLMSPRRVNQILTAKGNWMLGIGRGGGQVSKRRKSTIRQGLHVLPDKRQMEL